VKKRFSEDGMDASWIVRSRLRVWRLIATKFVRPFVKTNKTDTADAAAIWEAAQRPGIRFVPVKSEQQCRQYRSDEVPRRSGRRCASVPWP
jgi:transposase